MAFFRQVNKEKTTINKAGGQAFCLSSEQELVSLVLTSLLEDVYYEKANERLSRILLLMHQIPDKQFIAKLAVYARREFGLRTVSHILLTQLSLQAKGASWTKDAIAAGIYRPDDILEIVAYYMFLNKATKPKLGLPASLRKGINKALLKFDAYQLAKYKGDRTSVKMVDVFNLVHPKPETQEQAELFRALIDGTLKPAETWEVLLTQAGQKGETQEQVSQLKAQAWQQLLETDKLGYFALLRNLRNIIQQAPHMVDVALAQLVDIGRLQKSLVLPFRFITALQEVEKLPGDLARKVVQALENAIELSLSNVPTFDGNTLVVLDCSGSMQGKPIEIGALFASVIAKVNHADFMLFSSTARYVAINDTQSVLAIKRSFQDKLDYSGTDFHVIFKTATLAYDRIIILSDMQGWIGHDAPTQAFAEYRKKTGAHPFVYCFDLSGHGTSQFPPDQEKVVCLAGFSDKVFECMRLLEQDKDALISLINRVDF